MRRFPGHGLAVGLAVATLLVLSSSREGLAQAPKPAAAPAPAPEAGAEAKVGTPDSELNPSPYTYEVRGRRDPFRSLLLRNKPEKSGIAGLAGMTVDELELQGTIKTKVGWIAMMRGSDNRSYLLKKGQVLFDGEVTGIVATEVTFRQNVNDPASPKPFRDVVKSLALQHRP